MTKKALCDLETAGEKLGLIMTGAFDLIAKNAQNISEYEVQQFILAEYKRQGLVSASEPPIVAFGRNTDQPHYFPSRHHSDKLAPESLIMIDIWARLDKAGAPFADITWMGYYGNKPDERKLQVFQQVLEARDLAVSFIKRQVEAKRMPLASEVDGIVQDFFKEKKVGENFLHTTGHSLGFYEPHGPGLPIGKRNMKPLKIETGYTIEPGLYFEGEFGIRSELDFYLDKNWKMNITTGVQMELIIVGEQS